jgi:hypothetical protein
LFNAHAIRVAAHRLIGPHHWALTTGDGVSAKIRHRAALPVPAGARIGRAAATIGSRGISSAGPWCSTLFEFAVCGMPTIIRDDAAPPGTRHVHRIIDTGGRTITEHLSLIGGCIRSGYLLGGIVCSRLEGVAAIVSVTRGGVTVLCSSARVT